MTAWLESIRGETWLIVGIVCVCLWLVAAGVVWLRTEDKLTVVCICPTCGASGNPKRVVPGSTLIAVVLILFFVLPAVFYALLRQLGTRRECPVCQNEGMVPADSPRGKQLQNQFHSNE